MCSSPSQNPQDRDDAKGNQPDDQIDLSGITPFGSIGRLGVGGPVFPGKPEGHDQNGNNDEQHEQDCRTDDEPLSMTDGSLGIE